MSDEIAATPSNFRAAMAALDSAPDLPFDADGDAVTGLPRTSRNERDAPSSGGSRPENGGTERASRSSDFIAQRNAERMQERGEEPEADDDAEPENEHGPGRQVDPDPESDEDYGEEDGAEDDEEAAAEEAQEQLTKAEMREAREMRKALASPHLPEQLYDRHIRCTDGEREYDVPIGEMRNGFMRRDRFTRGMEEAKSLANEAKGMMDGMRGHVQQWRQNPEALVSSMRRLVGDEAFDKAVEMRAVQIYQLKNMPEGQRNLYLENERLKQAYQQAQMEAQRQPQPNPAEQHLPQVQNFVMQTVPAVFERHGIAQNDPAFQAFGKHLQVYWNGQPDTIHQAMDEAARATMDELRSNAIEYWEQYTEQQKMGQRQQAKMLKGAVQQHQQLGPRSLPGAAPRAADRNKRGTRSGGGSASDFAALRRTGGLGR